MIVIQLESDYGHTQLLENVARYVAQIRMRHPQGDLLLGGELAAQRLGQLIERLHLLAHHLDALPNVVAAAVPGVVVRVDGAAGGRGHGRRRGLCLVDNGTGKLLLSAGARADFAAHGAMEARAGREAQQRVENAGHAAG